MSPSKRKNLRFKWKESLFSFYVWYQVLKLLVSHITFSEFLLLLFKLCEISGCWLIVLILRLYLQMFTSLLYMVALPLSTNKISSESKFSSFYIMVSSGSYVLSNGSFLIYWIPVCHPPIESFYLFFGLWLANLEAFFHQHLNFTALLRYISVVKPSYMLIDCQNTSQIISSSDLSSFN